MSRTLITVLLIALGFAATAQGSSQSKLEQVASHYARVDVTVTCERLLAADGPQAWAELDTLTIHMDVSHCHSLVRPRSIEFPFALTVLLHESAHIRYGDTQNLWQSERRAELTARRTLKNALQRFYGFTPKQAWAAYKLVTYNPV